MCGGYIEFQNWVISFFYNRCFNWHCIFKTNNSILKQHVQPAQYQRHKCSYAHPYIRKIYGNTAALLIQFKINLKPCKYQIFYLRMRDINSKLNQLKYDHYTCLHMEAERVGTELLFLRQLVRCLRIIFSFFILIRA